MLTKDEFKVLVMLYAANVDGQIQKDELETILEKTNADTFGKMKKQFLKMSDVKLLDCIAENKGHYLSSQEDCRQLLDDIREILHADERLTVMEKHLSRVINKLVG